MYILLMRPYFITYLMVIGFSISSWGQLYFPLENYYSNEVNRYLVNHETNFYNSHLSMQPIMDNRSITDSIYYDDSKQYYWLTQKLFKENFLIFKGDDFWCAVDPILDLEGGTDLSVDSTNILYWNTRGVRVQAKFGERVAFSTLIYENQAIVPKYQSDYILSRGEFYPNSSGYTQNNGVVPGYARTKPFKTNGYDFSFAQGAVSVIANKNLNFQFGNGNHFIGDGHRSLLLSDFTINYPFGKIETNFWNGRVQYNLIYALHQNAIRLPEHTTPEANYERKIGTYHYLDFAINPNFTLGLFEGAVWRRSDSTGTHKPDYNFLNPVPFVNSIIKGSEDDGYNAILGLNASYSAFGSKFYGQLVFDHSGVDAYQAGVKIYDFIIPKLDVRAEYNNVSKNTYLTNDRRYNYSHYNLPLAHPFGAGFQELIFQLDYQHKRIFASNKLNYSKRYSNDTLINGTSVMTQSIFGLNDPTQPRFVVINQFEFGYQFNKRYNLQAFAGYLFRKEDYSGGNNTTNYIYLGIRTRLKNKNLDW